MIKKTIIFITQLVVAYYLGRYITDLIFARNYIIIAALCIGFLYSFFLSWERKMLLFSLMVFFPVSFPSSSLPINFLREMVAPILSFFLLFELFSNRQSLLSEKAKIFFIAIGVLTIWSIVNYIKRPVLGQLTFGVTMERGGIQNYYIIFVGITIFLCSFWFFRYKGLSVSKFLHLLLIFALIAGNLRVLGYFTGFTLPLLGGGFGGGGLWFERGWSVDFYRETYYAIGGLKQVSMVGFSTLIALLYKRRMNLLYLFCLINISILTILSGGRAPFVGLVFGIIMYVLLINRRLFPPLLSGFLIIVCTYMIFFQGTDISKSKFGKIAAFSGGLREQSVDRYYSFLYMLDIFMESPIFGKGIGYQYPKMEDFVKRHPEIMALKRNIYEDIANMTMSGSHGSYTSILAIFGIGGIFWLLTILVGGVYYAYKIIKGNNSLEESRLALFAYLMLSMMSIALIVGYAGYDCPDIWFLSGMVAGLMARNADGREGIAVKQEMIEYPGERLLWAEE
ncbi:MAG: hypothetical protein Fur0020_00220 [Thermodesulfovibrionia bacterium]